MKNSIKYTLAVILLLVITQVDAQSLEDAIGFTETVEDAPAAPINMLLGLGLVAGAFFGVKRLK